MSVAAVVVFAPGCPDPGPCLETLLPQTDEVVLIANPPGAPPVPAGVRVLENHDRPGFGANANRGIASTNTEFIAVSNPDTRVAPDAIAILAEFAGSHPRCGISGPQMSYADGAWQPTRRRFPTVSGTLVRRTPLRSLFPPLERQRAHYHLDERPTGPVEADWLLGAFLFLRREMMDELGGFDECFHLYGEDIDLAYRAAKAGWERWYVPAAHVTHDYAAAIDRGFFTRRTLWHLRSMARFVRKHPERLRAL
ncbi:MAG: glycosyltransferase family 2 protein [Gaiellaceae bacterium]